MSRKLLVKWLSTKQSCCQPSRSCYSHVRKCLPVVERIIPERIQNKTLHPWGDFRIPEVTYCDYVWDNIEEHAHLPGLACGVTGQVLLHGEIREQSLEVARSLAGLGLSKGDVVSVLLPNCLEYPAIVLGCLYLGLTVSPANPAYTPHEVSRQLRASEARLIFGHSTQIEKIKQTLDIMGEEAKSITTLFVGGKIDSCHGFIHWDDFLSMSSGQVPKQAEIDVKKDVAVLPFSSGTTGIPKGVALSQHNLVAGSHTLGTNDPEFIFAAAGTRQEVTITVLPMYHIYGLNVTMTSALHFGVKQVVLPGFDPQVFVAALKEHRPSFLHLVPPLLGFLANSPLVTPELLTPIRQINTGAAPAGQTLLTQFHAKAPAYTIVKEGWGMTEVSGGVTGISRAHGGLKMGSCNQLVSNVRLQIRDIETDEPRGPGEVGEVVVKGPMIMLGYSNNEEANKTTFDCEGWMRSGDIGYYDQDGFLYIVDRMKELIKVKGLQVAPAELEDVLRSLSGVKDVAVIGVKSEREGEVPRAYIVRVDESLTEEGVNSFMREQVSSHKQLVGGIEFVQNIPKSAAGKILRKDLKLMHEQSMNNK